MQKELNRETGQLLGHFKRVMHKFMQLFKSIEESEAAGGLGGVSSVTDGMTPMTQSIDKELVRDLFYSNNM